MPLQPTLEQILREILRGLKENVRGAPLPRGEAIDRRKFVRTAGGLLLTASAAEACQGTADAAIGSAVSGLVTLTITGLGQGLANGGTVSVVRTDISGQATVTVNISASGSGSESGLPVGTYQVTYNPPAGYTVANGTQNPQTVTLTTGGSKTITFAVTVVAANTGNISITVTGLGSGLPNGGSVSVLRTDISGQQPTNYSVSATGSTAASGLAVGTYQVTYSPPGGYTCSNSIQTVSVTTGATVPASFTVTAVVGGGQGNIYDQSFNAGFGSTFYDGGSNLLGNAGWVLDTATNPGTPWTKSIRADIAATPNNTGAPCDYGGLPPDNLVGSTATLNNSPVTSLYVRFAYKQSNPFNYNGTTSNADFLKLCRTYRPGGTGGAQCGLGIYSGGQDYFLISNDGYEPNNWYANCNLPAPTPNSLLGQWHWFEYFIDLSDTQHHLICKVWIDGVLYHYHDLAFLDSTGGPSATRNAQWVPGGSYGGTSEPIGFVQVCDTINSMASASSFWLQQVGISTVQMGVPSKGYP